MATIEAKAGTILDIANSIAPDGNLLAVAETLYKEIPVLQDAVWKEANDLTQHRYARQAKLPKSSHIKFNKGVGSDLGYNSQHFTRLSGRGNRPHVDARVIDMSPSPNQTLMDETRKSVMGIGQDFANDMFYSSSKADAEAFDGIAEFTSTLGDQVISAGGTSSTGNTSMYIVCWDLTNGAYMAYPRGSKAGIKFTDYGKVRVEDEDGNAYQAYEHEVEVTGGLCLADDRAVARICNINVSNPTAESFDENDVILLLNRMPQMLRKKAVAYVSRNLMAAIEMRANAKDNVYYSKAEVFGGSVPSIRGLPIKLDESISENEDVVA
jgi:hypothetical protein